MLINKPTDIHNYTEGIVKEMALFKMPRNEAILHTFRVMETFFTDAALGNSSLSQHYSGMRDFQDMLRYLMYWIFTFSDAGGKYVHTKAGHLKAVAEVFTCAWPYSKVYDFISAEERNCMHMTVDNTSKIISFEYLDENCGKQFGFKWFNKRQEIHDLLNSERIGHLCNDLGDAVSSLYKTVKIINEQNLSYNRTISVQKEFEKAAEDLVSQQFDMPSDWVIGDYTIGDFRLFWVHVLKIALIHIFAFRHAAESKGFKSYDSAIYNENRKAFLKHISMHSHLNVGTIDKIMQDLTYDVNIRHTDIMLQPFFLVEDQVFFSPIIISGSNAERNLLALLNRRHSKAYDNLKNKKQALMVAELGSLLESSGYFYKDSVELKNNGQSVTDIDLLLWDGSKQHILVVELKWLNGADSTTEVLNNDEEFKKGITQINKAYKFLKQNSNYLKSRFGLSSVDINGIIVSKIGLPSPFLKREAVVFVELKKLIEGIQATPGDIRGLYNFLKQTRPKDDLSNYVLDFSEEQIGEYIVRLPKVSCLTENGVS